MQVTLPQTVVRSSHYETKCCIHCLFFFRVVGDPYKLSSHRQMAVDKTNLQRFKVRVKLIQRFAWKQNVNKADVSTSWICHITVKCVANDSAKDEGLYKVDQIRSLHHRTIRCALLSDSLNVSNLSWRKTKWHDGRCRKETQNTALRGKNVAISK